MGAALEAAQDGRLVWPWVAWVLFLSMVVTALLTVAYSLRAWLLVFFGEPAMVAEPVGAKPVVEPFDGAQEPPVETQLLTGRFSYGVERTIVVRVDTFAAARILARRCSRSTGAATLVLRM